MSTLLGDPPVPRPLAAVTAADGAIDDLLAASLWTLSDGDSLDLLRQLDGLSRRVSAARLAAVREVDRRSAAVDAGSSSTAAWLRGVLQSSPRDAKRDVHLSASLERRWTGVAAVLASRAISVELAQIATQSLEALPTGVPAETIVEAESFLVEQAQQFEPAGLRRLALQLRATLDPDAESKLAEEEARAVRHRELQISPEEHGFRLRGWLDAESGAALLTAIDPLSGPRPSPEGPDLRSPAQRRGDALAELTGRWLDASISGTVGGERPHLTVTLSLDTLRSELSSMMGGLPLAELDRGGLLSGEAARRLACDAKIIPVVLGSQSQPLDVGRSSYVVPPSMRRALIARDGGCAFPQCGRPAAWSHAHHVVHWSRG